MKKAQTFLKTQDLFAHTLNVKYDKHKGTHGTILGGICSQIIRIFFLVYIALLLNKYVNNLED